MTTSDGAERDDEQKDARKQDNEKQGDKNQKWFVRRWPWAQRTLAHIDELRALAECVEKQTSTSPCKKLAKDASTHLDAAERAVLEARWCWRGSAVDGALANMNAAHALLLQIIPRQDVRAMLPDLVAVVESHLPPHDRRRMTTVAVAGESNADPAASPRSGQTSKGATAGEGNGRTPTVVERRAIAEAVRASYRVQESEVVRERSFTYLVYKWTVGLAVIAVLIGLLGVAFPKALPLCFYPLSPVPPTLYEVACPTAGDRSAAVLPANGWDYLVIELAGLVSAAVTGAAALHQIQGTTTASNVPIALAVLKLPTGALTAVLGILLMRGQFVPGLSALDTPAQIIAWAIVLGAAQQLFTRFVDERGTAVMRAVPAPDSDLPGKSARQTPHRT